MRLENNSVAGAQSRRYRPHAEKKWEVERADYTNDTDRNSIEPVLLAVHRRGKDLALHPEGISGSLFDDVLYDGDFEEGLERRAAQLLDDQVCNPGFVLFHESDCLFQNAPSLEGIDLRPQLLRRCGR